MLNIKRVRQSESVIDQRLDMQLRQQVYNWEENFLLWSTFKTSNLSHIISIETLHRREALIRPVWSRLGCRIRVIFPSRYSNEGLFKDLGSIYTSMGLQCHPYKTPISIQTLIPESSRPHDNCHHHDAKWSTIIGMPCRHARPAVGSGLRERLSTVANQSLKGHKFYKVDD